MMEMEEEQDQPNTGETNSLTREDTQEQEGKYRDTDEFKEDFSCSVCLRLAVQPTTLTCGHTSCRHCLARWYFTSKKKECPLCRQPYHGHPKINFHIRSMTANLFPREHEEREKELGESIEDRNIIKKYDEELEKERTSPKKDTNDITVFFAGVACTVFAFLVVYVAWYWQSGETNLLILKPVETWKSHDVASWLSDMPWAKDYASYSIENKIDGNVLLSMDAESMKSLLNVTNPVHEKALLFAIETLKEHGLKMPSNLWEYKAIYPGRCLFLVYGLKDFPRTTFLYLYVYFTDDMFVPFVRSVTQSAEEAEEASMSKINTTMDSIKTVQWVTFFFYATVLPEWLVILLTYQMFSHHFVTPMFVLCTAVLYQVMEILQWVSFFRKRQWGSLFGYTKQYLKQLMSAFMFMVVWPVVPSFICDIFFYGALYISPIQASMAVYNKLIHLNDPEGPN